MSEIRHLKVGSLLHRTLAGIFLQFDLFDITINEIKVSPNLQYAKVYVSSYARQNSVVVDDILLNKSMISKKLRDMVNLRKLPKLEFILDETLDNAERINSLLKLK